MKRVRISILLLTLLPLAVGALPVRYSYDAAGNRVKREIVMSSSPSLSPKKQMSYTDDIADDYKVKITPSAQDGIVLVEIVSRTDLQEGSVDVFSVKGMRVLTTMTSGGRVTIDLSDKRSGVYILHVNVGGNETDWKIIKK